MIRTALRNPYLVVVFSLAITVLGSFAYNRIPADLLPQFNIAAAQIVCFYPGMPPEIMEKDIMSRLQRWSGQSMGIEHQEAKAMQGVCVVKDFFNEGVSLDSATSQVSMYAMSDMFYLPKGTIPPMVMPFDPTASVPLCLVVVSNPQMDEQELYDVAYFELRNKLQAIQGVIAPAVYGGKLRRILAYARPKDLAAHHMTLLDVQEQLLQQNTLIPTGSIKDGDMDWYIESNANVDKVEDLNNMMIRNGMGQQIFMRDVAEVKNASQIQSNVVRVNGSRKAYIPIYRQPGSNTIKIVEQIKRKLSSIETKLKVERSEDPKIETLTLSVMMDQSIGVKESNTGLQIAAGLGALLAGLVVLVFLRSVRSTFIIVLAIPLAILASIFWLFMFQGTAFGGTLNAITLGGLALAIGILVDQSIVVLENVSRHAAMGKTPTQAALDGAQEVAIPMFVATLTFAIVFFPVVFLTGVAKFLFQPLAVSASIAIIASYVLAITLIPAYFANFMKSESFAANHEEQEGAMGRWFGRFLDSLLTLRWLVVAGAVALFIGAGFLLANNVGQELFPQVDSGQITINVRMPTGTRIERTEEEIQKIEAVITDLLGDPDPTFAVGEEADPESDLQLLVSNIGVLMDWPAAYTPNGGPMDAFMLVQTKKHRSIFEIVEELREKLNGDARFEGIEFAFDTGGMLTAALNMGEPSPIHFQIQSSKLETAQEIGKVIVDIANKVEGTADARIAQRIDYPVVKVNIDRQKAQDLNVNADMVVKNLVSATNSSINFEPAFWIDPNKGNHYMLGVQYPEELLESRETLLDIPVRGGMDGVVYLRDVLDNFEESVAPYVVFHRNISRVTDIYVNVRPGYDIGGVVSQIEAKIVELGAETGRDERGPLFTIGTIADPTPDDGVDPAEWASQPLSNANEFKGRSIRMMGEVKTMRASFEQFRLGLVVASILVYLVMVAQFKSFIDPFIVLFAVPLGFIGVVAALLITNTNLSIMAFMGIVMIVGIVVEYTIVLVDFANRDVELGKNPRDAILHAAKVRLRPILMTSMTTWLAMLPMAIGFGGGEANVPLARTIIGGVIGATFLSLIVVPCLYVIIKRPHRKSSADELNAQPDFVTT